MEYDLPFILAFIVLLFFTLMDMVQRAFNAISSLVPLPTIIVFSGRGVFSPVDEYPRSRPRTRKRRGALGQSPGMIERITALFGLTNIVSLFFVAAGDSGPTQVRVGADRRPSITACFAWIARRIVHCLWSLAITLSNFTGTCINRAKEWSPFSYIALRRQLEAAQREARLLEEGLYQTTVEIKNLKALYKVKDQENLELARRVEEVEERTMVVENLEARLEEKTKQEEALEEEKQAVVQEMETLSKEKKEEIERLKMEKEAEIVELKEQSRVAEEKNAEHIAALKEETEKIGEEKAAVIQENEILKEENTKIQKRVEEVQVDANVAQEKARVASAQLFGMEIARKEEGKKRMEAESMVATLREELEIAKQNLEEEKKDREAERVAMELERATFEENMRKSKVEHRQEIDAFVGQLQGAWNRALNLDSQLDIANHHKNAFQAQLKNTQDSLAAMTGEKEILATENQNLQEDVARLREEMARAVQKQEVEEKKQKMESKVVVDLGINLEKLKRNFEDRDRIRRDIPGSDETTVTGECSVMDGADTVLDITVDRIDTPGRKKQLSIKNKVATPSDALMVATKDNLAIDAGIPVVSLPAAGTIRTLPPIQSGSVHVDVPSVETNSMVPFSFDPAPIQVRLQTAPEPPIVWNARGNSRLSQPMKAKEAAPFHYKKRKSRRGVGREQWEPRNGTLNETWRSPLGSIINQSSQNDTDRGKCKGILGRGGFSG